MIGRGGKTMLYRFEEKFVVSPNGCWEWTAAKHNRGYGYFYTSKEYSPRKMDFAHRVSLFLYKQERDDKLCVRHRCDNTSCVNPEHLEWGTHQDNMDDMNSKGRAKPASEKMSQRDCNKAIKMRAEGVMVKDIAAHFGIDSGQASRISRGQRKIYK